MIKKYLKIILLFALILPFNILAEDYYKTSDMDIVKSGDVIYAIDLSHYKSTYALSEMFNSIVNGTDLAGDYPTCSEDYSDTIVYLHHIIGTTSDGYTYDSIEYSFESEDEKDKFYKYGNYYLSKFTIPYNDDGTSSYYKVTYDIDRHYDDGVVSDSCLDGYAIHLYEVSNTPSISVSCDNELISVSDTCNCNITLSTDFDITEAQFYLKSEDLSFDEITVSDDWEYSIIDSSTVSFYYSGSLKSSRRYALSSFKARAKSDISESSVNTTINLLNFVYSDTLVSNAQGSNTQTEIVVNKVSSTESDNNEVSTGSDNTEISTKSDTKEETKNPKTGYISYNYLMIAIILLSFIVYYEIKKKNIFKDI